MLGGHLPCHLPNAGATWHEFDRQSFRNDRRRIAFYHFRQIMGASFPKPSNIAADRGKRGIAQHGLFNVVKAHQEEIGAGQLSSRCETRLKTESDQVIKTDRRFDIGVFL